MMTNSEIAELLRRVAASYQITGENRFRIMAYERAADSIEHLTREVKDVWEEGKLDEIPGIGTSIAQHLNELMRTGHVRHFEAVLSKLPSSLYPLLSVPGLGPKKAYKLVTELKLHDPKSVLYDLVQAAREHKIAQIEGFGEKSEEDILQGIELYKKGKIKQNRMVLPQADQIALDVLQYLFQNKAVLKVDTLGSLRRQVSTIGDIDISVATHKPETVINHFVDFPHQKIIEKGPTGASLLLSNGRQVDLRVQTPETYGAMLQYFTGSKNHNIKLREYAQKKGLSLSEYGIKNMHTGKTKKFETEEEFYQALRLTWMPPELREDRGEIEAALREAQGKRFGLPRLVELTDIRGDLHMHTNYDFPVSHDIGGSHVHEHLNKALELGYEYIGVSDHNPRISEITEKQIIKVMSDRKRYYEQQYYSWKKSAQNKKTRAKDDVKLFIMCEVDVLSDGKLALPESAFEYVDAIIVSLHSSFNQPKKDMTRRIVKALTAHEKVRIFGHPTARLLQKRDGVDADWMEIFSVCKEQDKALEINAYFDRLDLPDSLVFDAVKHGVKLCINTDSHVVGQMDLMKYGVAVAKRGWATKHDIVDTMEYNEFRKWLIQ